MAKHDSASKRSVPSPRPSTLFENMGLGKQPSGPNVGASKPMDLALNGGGKKRGGKSGISSKKGYDVKTRVNVGSRSK